MLFSAHCDLICFDLFFCFLLLFFFFCFCVFDVFASVHSYVTTELDLFLFFVFFASVHSCVTTELFFLFFLFVLVCVDECGSFSDLLLGHCSCKSLFLVRYCQGQAVVS